MEGMKKVVYAMENEVSTKQTQMFIEMEGFIKMRKRDKNDQNALIRNLQAKVDEAEKTSQYNRKAVENVATSVVMILESLQMTLASEEQDEIDRHSMAMLGSRGNQASGDG